jgi:hypothetical protein
MRLISSSSSLKLNSILETSAKRKRGSALP